MVIFAFSFLIFKERSFPKEGYLVGLVGEGVGGISLGNDGLYTSLQMKY